MVFVALMVSEMTQTFYIIVALKLQSTQGLLPLHPFETIDLMHTGKLSKDQGFSWRPITKALYLEPSCA
jgi:hypothetical protein